MSQRKIPRTMSTQYRDNTKMDLKTLKVIFYSEPMSYLDEYEWYLTQDLRDYSGEWVIIVNKHVFAHGMDVKKMLDEVKKKFPNKEPLLTKVDPNNPIML